MISFDEAIGSIEAAARPLGSEMLALDRAAGRVLAAPVFGAIDSPRADVSAMDGYAVRSADLVTFPLGLTVAGESLPGAPSAETVEPGTCARIFTGAALPKGADRIVIQEQVRREGDQAIIEAASAKSWVRPKASDFCTGDELLPTGRLLDPAALIAAAGGDVAEALVFIRPRLALLVTGDELVDAGTARSSPFAVPDSVSFGIAALAETWGAEIVRRTRLRDELEAMAAAARDAADCADVIIVTGGASVGERDFAKAMFEPLGLELLFSRVAIRPGMPAWFGRAAGKLVLGLPGNPTSALVTARLLLAPLLALMHGRSMADALPWKSAPLATPLPACDSRETFHRARLLGDAVETLSFQESHAQKALADADSLVRQPAHSPPIPAGETVQVLRL